MKINFSGAEDEHLNTNTIVVPEETLRKEAIRNLDDMISYVYRTEPRARRSFFKADGTLANGTICLIDDQDAEMRELKDQAVDSSSSVVFISTLHGG